ncbi:MAG: aminotransferase class I/II-fold pyridoxal phosphate-dependent enzyme [Clostridia bacterium]|nr:aminotransferase class I/II-fold pyridoxal phosphate-dependent enzyme [Clostridia bacterium]
MIKPEDFVSKKVKAMPFSGIRKFFDIASEMEGVISLGVGEPDFDTPWAIREKGIYNLEKGKTVYSANAGLMELREEISKYLKRTIDVLYCPKGEILVTVGASESIDLALRATLEPGDEVLVPEPSYVSYKPCVTMADGIPVVVNTKAENSFKLTVDDIKDKITNKTKALILPYPNNPTGAIMEKDDIEKLAEFLKDKDILVISDEIYSELTYGDKKHFSIASIDYMRNKTIVINGFSKSYAMTGWRLGYAAGPEPILTQMTKVHQYCIMCAPTTSQQAAVEALRSCDDAVDKMRREYDRRRRFMRKGFIDMGLDCYEAQGAFYLFPCIKSTGLSSDEFCERLLFEEKVAVVPGTAFGECGEGFIRCSYAYSVEEIRVALDKIAKFVKRVKAEKEGI